MEGQAFCEVQQAIACPSMPTTGNSKGIFSSRRQAVLFGRKGALVLCGGLLFLVPEKGLKHGH